MLVTYGKHTHVTSNEKKKTRVAEKADFSQFFVVLNFPFVFQYTHMLAFFFHTDAIEINWKSIP